MFSGGLMLFVTAIFVAIHIGIWHMLPRKLRHMMFANPIFAFIVDFAGSGLITVFTGVASFVGICNMAASVCFGIYALICVWYFGIKGIKLAWYKLFGLVPIWPCLQVVYSKDGRVWSK